MQEDLIEIFAVSEMLTGRKVVKSKDFPNYHFQYEEIRKSCGYSNVMITYDGFKIGVHKYEESKLKHVLKDLETSFNFEVSKTTKEKKYYKNNQFGKVIIDVVSVYIIDRDKVIDCWKRVLQLLLDDNYL